MAIADTLHGNDYITVIGGDSAVLKRVDLSLNLVNLADTLTNAQYFVDSLVTNNSFRDSIISLITRDTLINNSVVKTIMDSVTIHQGLGDSVFMAVKNRADSITSKNHITINGGNRQDSAVLNNVDLGLDVVGLAHDTLFNHTLAHDTSFSHTLISDTAFSHTLAHDTSFNHTLARDTSFINVLGRDTTLFNNVAANGKPLTSDSLILVNGDNLADSAVLRDINLTINTHGLAHDTSFTNTLGNDSNFISTITTNNQFHDSIVSMLTRDTLINNSVVKTIMDSVTIHQGLGDSVFMAVKNRADSITSKNYITINGGNRQDSAVLNNVDLGLDVVGLAHDTLFNHTLAHDTSFSHTLISDTAFSHTLAHDTSFNHTLARDTSFINVLSRDTTLFNNVAANGKPLTSDSLILVNGDNLADSAVLRDINLTINTHGLAHDTSFTNTLGNDSNFISTITTNNQFHDSIVSMLTRDTLINNSVVKTIMDSVTIHQGLGDSVFMAVKNRADSITSKNYITINGGNRQDSAVLNNVRPRVLI